MTTFSKPLSNTGPIKMLYIGHTGAGKTGSTISLAASGYKMLYLSFDGVPEILSELIHHPDSIYTKERPRLWTKEMASSISERIHFEAVTEGHIMQGTKLIPKGDSWQRANQFLNNWIDSETKEKFGNWTSWGTDTVLVIDSFSRMCESVMNLQLVLGGNAAKGPQVGQIGKNDYTPVYRNILDFLDFIKSSEIKCNVILICHVQKVDMSDDGKDDSEYIGFPQTLASGKRLGPLIGQYFNHTIMAKQSGNDPMVKREIMTRTIGDVQLKTTAPLSAKRSYPLETGLAEYFLAVRGPLNSTGEK